MIRARSTSHRMDSSWAFFIIPFRRFEKVTCRLFLFSIRFSWNFPLPISLSDGETNFVGCGRYVGDSGFFLREGKELSFIATELWKKGLHIRVYILISHWTAACFMKRCVLGPTGCPAAKGDFRTLLLGGHSHLQTCPSELTKSGSWYFPRLTYLPFYFIIEFEV